MTFSLYQIIPTASKQDFMLPISSVPVHLHTTRFFLLKHWLFLHARIPVFEPSSSAICWVRFHTLYEKRDLMIKFGNYGVQEVCVTLPQNFSVFNLWVCSVSLWEKNFIFPTVCDCGMSPFSRSRSRTQFLWNMLRATEVRKTIYTSIEDQGSR